MSNIGGFCPLALAGPTTSPTVKVVGNPDGSGGGGEKEIVICEA